MENVTAKRTKVVATIGPATSSVEALSKLLKAGMNIIRMNFSHGDFAEHQEKIDNLRIAEKKTGLKAATLQDLAGPKIRTGEFSTPTVELIKGSTVTITTETIVGDATKFSINYKPFPKEVELGGFVLIDDGKKKLQITAIKGNEVICKVILGGITKPRRGVNLPGAHLSIASLTDKDKKDIAFGLKNKVDFFAFSFVRRPSDVLELRAILAKAKSDAKIIAKIEDQEALDNIDELVRLVDGVMIGRGDLAIEIGAENMPVAQKMIIKKCNKAGKPVITATQMLESMIKNATPTRAEVSDVTNAIFDGTDAVMLSEETTLGDYPVESVEWMTRIANSCEKSYPVKTIFGKEHTDRSVTDAIGASAVQIAKDTGAKLIVALTSEGHTVNMISRHKPKHYVIGFSQSARTVNQMQINFGVIPALSTKFSSMTDIMKSVRELAKKLKLGVKGDKVVVVSGNVLGKGIPSNSIDIEVL